MSRPGKRGKATGKTRYVFSYEPLGPAEPQPDAEAAREARDDEVAAFLTQVAELAFEAGPKGLELRSVDVPSRTCSFRHTAEPDPRPLARAGDASPPPYETADEPTGVVLPGSPSWAHLAHLIAELPFLSSFRGYGPEGGPELHGVDAPTREWADVLVKHRGEHWRVRVELEGRERPIEFPGMEIGELFGEGGYEKYLVEGTTDLLDAGI